ncbi:MAG: formate--tetrahydrofolate ligase, partial [Erysipelothrix sp.]|nr:formate--tetrahydrofolate ligase [Erysipelothrix sp.]
MKTDIEIAKSIKLKPVEDLLKIDPNLLEKYGPYKAKVDYENIKSNNPGKLILVTAVSPTPAGEGKTTTNIGLSMAINRLGHSSISVLREPSLGPVFGMKGGATGGGFAQVLPMED